jgi:catechol 2,3-dioxygenase-like lactoylglutathione lyase family enzyme
VNALAAVTFVVREYDEAIAWFTTVLGFALLEDSRQSDTKRWVRVAPANRGTALLLARAATPEQSASIGHQTGGRVAFFLDTDDFGRDHAAFHARGVHFVEAPRQESYGKVAVFTDLYGNRWDLVERRTEIGSVPFDPAEAIPLLQRTPGTLRALLGGLPEAWVTAHEGPGTWSAYEVVGHLIHGERTDWIVRTEHILKHGATLPFAPFDREAMRQEAPRPLAELLDTFAALRSANLARLEALHLTPAHLARPGLHPALGSVTLDQHLASWVVHDLSHLAQIARVMGKRYRTTVGPWRAYLPMLDRG